MRKCKICEKEKDLKKFNFYSKSKPYPRTKCKDCEYFENKLYREKNKEHLADKRRIRLGYEKRKPPDPEKRKKSTKRYRLKNKWKIRCREILNYAISRGKII